MVLINKTSNEKLTEAQVLELLETYDGFNRKQKEAVKKAIEEGNVGKSAKRYGAIVTNSTLSMYLDKVWDHIESTVEIEPEEELIDPQDVDTALANILEEKDAVNDGLIVEQLVESSVEVPQEDSLSLDAAVAVYEAEQEESSQKNPVDILVESVPAAETEVLGDSKTVKSSKKCEREAEEVIDEQKENDESLKPEVACKQIEVDPKPTIKKAATKKKKAESKDAPKPKKQKTTKKESIPAVSERRSRNQPPVDVLEKLTPEETEALLERVRTILYQLRDAFKGKTLAKKLLVFDSIRTGENYDSKQQTKDLLELLELSIPYDYVDMYYLRDEYVSLLKKNDFTSALRYLLEHIHDKLVSPEFLAGKESLILQLLEYQS